MASTTTTTSTAFRTKKSFSRSLRRPSASVSTPDLNLAFAAHSRLSTAGLSRKTSLAALTSTSLASIPDVSESYGLDTVISESSHDMAAVTPGNHRDDVVVGDTVEVPGGMYGTARFVGSVQGKKGVFVGVELHPEFASRGKNNGDVDGINYFQPDTPGTGIFVPVAKALRRDLSERLMDSFPKTPTPAVSTGYKGPGQGSSVTPPTPGLPKFSASVGPGVRAPSPQGKRPRTSLPRPDSPVRRMQMTPGPRPSMTSPSKGAVRYGSPTNANKFAQSVRGTSVDPSKKNSKLDLRSVAATQRSTSAMGPTMDFDDEMTSLGQSQLKSNGLGASVSAFSLRRPTSRANNPNNDEELDRLRSLVEDRDRQLKDQSATLAEMESSLVELQSIIENNPDGPSSKRNSADDKDTMQLRLILREKNDKIAMLTSEFDAHRADFRSTIDTLEMASTETERVYERRIEELSAELRELESRNLDVDTVASQLKQLEELVQELEEGLEDARRGEAEARGEAEFLRGEVERTRTELQREREKSSTGAISSSQVPHGAVTVIKELEQKEDEIRGLKAIIHSFSRDLDAVPGSGELTPTLHDKVFTTTMNLQHDKAARDDLEKQIAELQALLDKRSSRADELEHELENLRRGTNGNGRNSLSNQRSSLRDSRDTVVPIRVHEPRSLDKMGSTLGTMHESDTHSSATGSSALWCEICETSGHDILSCTNMFGPDGTSSTNGVKTDDGLRPRLSPGIDSARPAPLSPARSRSAGKSTTPVKILPNPMESGPVAGKESGILDPEKWCAVCERDGHDSVDCPFEDAF